LFPRQLPHHVFHLQLKQRSQNFGRVQAAGFDDVINMPRVLGVEEAVDFFSRAGEGRGDQQIALFGFGGFGLS
jgi:hypothetical protein